MDSFQIAGWNRISRGKSSRRPASISNISTHFEKMEKCAKFWVGPTISRPGPILFNVAITAVKFVTSPLFSKEINRIDVVNISMNVMK